MANNQKIKTFLIFSGNAEEALNFYVSLFPESKIVSIKRYGKNESGTEGTVQQALFSLNGQLFMCIDSPVKHGFTFTPSMSLFVSCDSEAEVDKLYKALSKGGAELMPLGSYPFAREIWLDPGQIRGCVATELGVGIADYQFAAP